jgi:hypothetical protein
VTFHYNRHEDDLLVSENISALEFIKSQIVICAKTKLVIAVFVDVGSRHDFAIWKKTIGVRVVKHIKIQADKGYQGIAKYHKNASIFVSAIPNPKKTLPLSPQ